MLVIFLLLFLYSLVVTYLLIKATMANKFSTLNIPFTKKLPEPWGQKIWAELIYGEGKQI